MSTIKHPKAKKLASLKRDHRVFAREGDKTFRGVWRKKKARMARKARADSKRALRSAPVGEIAPPRAKQPRQLRKSGVVTLERKLQVKKHDRAKRFSKFEYSSSKFTR